MTEGLEEVRSSTLAESVERSLIEYIHKGGLLAGDSLPKEEELAASLKVSRNIVREGVSRLKTLGLVESRKRRGMVVSAPNPFGGMNKIVRANVFSDAERRDLVGLRIILELGMADYIYERKTPEHLKILRKLAGKNAALYAIEKEVEFHSYLFSIGGNATAVRFRDILSAMFRDITVVENAGEKLPPGHTDICDALEHGTNNEFRAVLRAHFAPYETA